MVKIKKKAEVKNNMSSMETSNLTKEMLDQMFKEGKRFDGRGLLDMRDFEVESDISNKAEGSARVRLGKTEVVVGVKLGLGEPYPDSPDEGNMMVSGDLLPMASPRFEQGPPKFDGIELPRLVDRAIRSADLIQFDKLCIKKGEKVWTVFIDVYPINDDGALVDAANIAAIVALKNAVMPGLDKDGNVDYKTRTKDKVPIEKDILPLSITFYKLGDSLILDPTREEEEACEAKVTWGISKWKDQYMMNSCQKGWEETFSKEEVAEMMKIIPKKYEEVMKKLKKFLK